MGLALVCHGQGEGGRINGEQKALMSRFGIDARIGLAAILAPRGGRQVRFVRFFGFIQPSPFPRLRGRYSKNLPRPPRVLQGRRMDTRTLLIHDTIYLPDLLGIDHSGLSALSVHSHQLGVFQVQVGSDSI